MGYALDFIEPVYFLSHLFSDTLAHMLRVYPQVRDPRTLGHAKTECEYVADHEADDPAVKFGDETGTFFIQTALLGYLFEFRRDRRVGDGAVYVNDFVQIFFVHPPYLKVFHRLLPDLLQYCITLCKIQILVNSNDFYLPAYPVRRKINPSAVSARFNDLFEHLFSIYFKFHFRFERVQ